MPQRIGVCSWSLQPASAADLVAKVRRAGCRGVQLALDPIRLDHWGEIETVNHLNAAGIEIISGMMGMEGEDYSTLQSIARTGGVRPDATWPVNLAAAKANAALAHRLGLKLVTFHAGFIPHDRDDRERAIMLGRLRELVDVFDARGVRVAFETGQENADTLLEALADLDRPHAGVNFDPANMILYGMVGGGGPIAALKKLGRRVAQVHIKDATPATTADAWGEETPAGTGEVDWPAFFAALREIPIAGDLLIEREAGGSREADIVQARELVERHMGGGAPRPAGAIERNDD